MGEMLGRYRLLRRIGAGGMAEIWKARIDGPAGFAKTVAIKRVLPDFASDEEFITMFVDEAKLVATLVHPNIVQVFDFGEMPGAPGDYFLAMEYVSGQNLATLLSRLFKSGRTVPIDVALFIALESVRALTYAHAATDAKGKPLAIVHRDVSPHNVLVSYRGEVKVTDFGIAKVASASSRTATGVFKGKLAYMSPEQARLDVLDGRSDVFSLGIVLFECLAGKRLFADRASEQIRARVLSWSGPVDEEIAAFPPPVQDLLRRSLAGDRALRAEARQLEHALADALGAHGASAARERLAALMVETFPAEMKADLEEPEEEPIRGGTVVSASTPEAVPSIHPATRKSPQDPAGPLAHALNQFGPGEPAPASGSAEKHSETEMRAPVARAPSADRFRLAAAVGAGAAAVALGLVVARFVGTSPSQPATTPPATPLAAATATIAAAPSIAPPASAAPTPAPSPALSAATRKRLESLKHLHDDGLIDDDEYAQRRKSILAGH